MEKKEITLKDKMELITNDYFLSERFGTKLLEAIESDDTKMTSVACSLINAYNTGDTDLMLIAICGWSMETLVKKAISVRAYTKQGDFVTCSACGGLMIVSAGADECPCCFSEGTMNKIYPGADDMENLSIQTLKQLGYELDREAPTHNYEFDFLVLTRSKDKEHLKERIETHTGLTIISINEEDLSERDNEEDGYKQADRSLLVDFDPGDNGNFCTATLFYYTDRMEQIVITETAFDWG